MNEPKRLPPRGPRDYDLERLQDEQFERLCARLILLEYPSAFKPANTADGGADMVLPGPGASYERCWQAKHYPDAIHWNKCKQSLATAKKRWGPREYTFCFPRELTEKEQKTFDRHFRSPEEEVEVNHWNGEAVLARLNGSEAGERVARTFFEDPELDKESIVRAIQAQGPLETAQHALDRMLPVGGFLASRDAYFSYPAATHETGEPSPPLTPGTVMSVAQIDETTVSRIDAVPRDKEALERYGPEIRLQTTPDKEGERAAELLQAALERGESVRLTSGVKVTMTKVPPGLEGLMEEPVSEGIVELGPAEPPPKPPPPPWVARLKVETERGEASLDVTLKPGEKPPPEWDGILVGSFGGLEVRALFRYLDDRGQISWSFTHRFDDSSLRDRVTALRMFDVLHGTGDVVITDHGGTGRPEMRVKTAPQQLPDDWAALIAFVEDLLAISQWSGAELNIPETISREIAYTVATVARAIRDGGQWVRWDNLEPTVTAEGLTQLERGGRVLVEQDLAARIDDRVVELGLARLLIDDYRVAEANEKDDGTYAVRLEPPDETVAQVFQTLHKRSPPAARKPPPPPPRKRGRRRHRGRRKR